MKKEFKINTGWLMNSTWKNFLKGAGSVLDISGREPIHPDDFLPPPRDYMKEICNALYNDRAMVISDMGRAWRRVTSIHDKK